MTTLTTPPGEGRADMELSAYGPARSTVQGAPLSAEELRHTNAYWRASLYLCLGMLYLKDNPLLRQPLTVEQTKARLLGHWGSDAGQCFTYIHFNRLIKKYDLNAIFISGPGHGAPAVLSQAYLEGTYSEVYPDITQDVDGMRRFFKQFSFPGGIGSHATPETPGSIHEGGELGYSLSHAYGTVLDNPDLIALTMVGDGEAETGPLATSWHSNKFLNPIRDGAVLPVLHLNGYKINNPTVLARISHAELEALFTGYGYTPYFVEGSNPETMHQAMAATLEHCVKEIREIQAEARRTGVARRPRWPMIVLRSPKGWTAPRRVDGHYLGRLLAIAPDPARRPGVQPEPSEDARGVDAQLQTGGSVRRIRAISCGIARCGSDGLSQNERKPDRQRWLAARAAHAARLSRIRRRGPSARGDMGGQRLDSRELPARSDAVEHGPLPPVRARRNPVQPPRRSLWRVQESLDG